MMAGKMNVLCAKLIDDTEAIQSHVILSAIFARRTYAFCMQHRRRARMHRFFGAKGCALG